jgi:predicted O-linked N-acetylglucosamine transferase (SPINDLY family)
VDYFDVSHMTDDRYALERALQLQQSGDYDAAEIVLRELLRAEPENCDGLHLLGLCYHARNQNKEALVWLERAIEVQPGEAMFHSNAGLVAMALGALKEAATMFEAALRADSTHSDAYNNLALVRERQGRLMEAKVLLEKATLFNPQSALAYFNQGNVLRGLGQTDEAITSYRNAIRLVPQLAPAYNGLGNALRERDCRQEAVTEFDKAIALDVNYADAYFNRAMTHAAQGETALADAGLTHALEIRDDARFRIAQAGLMPVIPASTADIACWRARMEERFENTLRDVDFVAGDPTQVQPMSFYLAYHGENDRQQMEILAQFYRRLFPELTWEAPHCVSPVSCAGRLIRIGVVSRYFGEHAVTLMTYGLMAGLPRGRFNVIAVTFSGEEKNVSSRIKDAADDIVFIPKDIQLGHEAIAAQAFDVLLYADIGMEPLSYYLAFARLAPVQCVTWGHPDTTGLATVDYYISNDLAEPENGQESYTEKLIRLEGVQSWYPRMPKPKKLPDRISLGLPEEGAFYLCPQNLIKIHPDMDLALAGILKRDETGCLVIFDSADPNWTRLLLSRWAKVFGDKLARVHVLPQRSLDEFMGVLAVADVVLDSWPFGAGNTNYQTFAMGVPVVTFPGQWIRGRGTLAHYRHMGFEDCIAQSPEEYVDIAVRLGTDTDFRNNIVCKINDNANAVLEDEVCVRDLARFLEEVAP